MPHRFHFRQHPRTDSLLTLLLLFCVFSVATQARSEAPETALVLSLEQIEFAKTAAASDETLDQAQMDKAKEMLEQAKKWLLQAGKARNEISQLQALVQDAPQQIQALRSSMEALAAQNNLLSDFIEKSDLAALELRISQEDLNLAQARDQQKRQMEVLSKLLAGSKQINAELTAHGSTLAQIESDLDSLPGGEPKRLSQARMMSLQGRQALRQAQIDLLKLRLGNQSLLTNLAQAKRDAAVDRVSRLQSTLESLNQAAARIRENQAKQARQVAEQLREQTANLPQPLQAIAQENAETRSELEQLVYWEKRVTQQLTTIQQKLQQIQNDFEHSKQRVEVVGTSQAIGKMLSRRRQALPSLRSYSRSSAERKHEINLATDRQIDIEELLLQRGNLPNHVGQITSALITDLSAREADELKKQAFSLVGARREALNELQKVYGRYIAKLTALDLAERQLLEVSESYVAYINDQLIWISSGGLLDILNPAQLASSLAWLTSPEKWLDLGSDILKAGRHNLHTAFFVLMIFILVIWKRRYAKLQIPLLARSTRKIRTDSIHITLLALFHTLVKIAALPVLMIGLGLLLKTLPSATPFTLAIASSLIRVGITLAAALLLYQVCLPEGVGIRHLRWNSGICQSVARELRWIIPTAAPIRFLVALAAGNTLAPEAQIIGKATIIALMIIVLLFTYRLLHKQGSLMLHWSSANPHALLVQLHFLWFPLLLLIGIGLIVSTGLGYMTLSLRLLERVELTFWFFVGLFTLKELLLRYLFIAERRLRYENALQRRQELRAQREQEQQQSEDESTVITAEIPELNFDALGEQAKRLVRFGYLFGSVVGAWLIWADLLPALEFLNDIQLPFNTSHLVDGIVTETPLTLRDIVIGAIILIVTILAAKNLPGVLEITLLQRLPLEAGARYALTTLLQYLIAGIGIIMAFSSIGFQWSSIQWLVAALGVGLGFGLQEIVANFISGIILLFERPIRVGDVVTLDTTTGVVSRIRIRATTIINYDKQEMLIPNKAFITGRVINWTLTDKVNRVIVTVGVAYGSDVSQAMGLMLEAAEENENVLQEPKPVATFEAFGDNALTLLLRAYLGSMDNRLATITALHETINRKFNEAGIDIPFPQRDLHLHGSTPLEVRINHPINPATK
ncbi:MAG: mechanosensitive ion channel [Candidatus Thiodiazotropha sp. (ex Epidulcina cf. delphinae)]|nr:mechanosensitive ion channel [Candidatus Thiodiazotropha sp. (ex Epidulcina cf. delphinae)]